MVTGNCSCSHPKKYIHRCLLEEKKISFPYNSDKKESYISKILWWALYVYKFWLRDQGNLLKISGFSLNHQKKERKKNQASSWSKFSTVDYLQVINELPEKMNEWHEPLYILFTNCRKDLNSAEGNSVLEACQTKETEHGWLHSASEKLQHNWIS